MKHLIINNALHLFNYAMFFQLGWFIGNGNGYEQARKILNK